MGMGLQAGFMGLCHCFEVREKRDHEAEPYVYEGPRFYWKHLEYLGPDRKQLKNIIVWLTK
jgi:hypothetical protein